MKVIYNSNSLPFQTPKYEQLLCSYDPERTALWCYFNPKPRPSFNPEMLAEMRDLQKRLTTYLTCGNAGNPIHYFVYASAFPDVFNLGGDVDLFVRLITEQDRNTLSDYGRLCIDVVYANATSCGISDLTTMALVQGSALGGGFECALSCNTVIAEENAQMGFPEILFNLFPGMGALSFLSRRINLAQAQRLVQNGKMHNGRTMWEMGVIEELAEDGTGVHAINQFIRHHQRTSNGLLAIRQASERIAPLTYQELLDIVELWVDAALRLTPRDLRLMSKIVAAQNRLEDRNEDRIDTHKPKSGPLHVKEGTELELVSL